MMLHGHGNAATKIIHYTCCEQSFLGKVQKQLRQCCKWDLKLSQTSSQYITPAVEEL